MSRVASAGHRGKIAVQVMRLTVGLAIGAAALGRGQAEMLLNPGFEGPYLANGLATNWSRTWSSGTLTCSQETANVHGGQSCQKIVISNLSSTSSLLVFQAVAVQPGHVYQGSVWLRAAARLPVQFELERTDVPPNYAGATRRVTVDTNWQQVVIRGGFNQGAAAEVALSFLDNGVLWVDDASLTDVTSNCLSAPLSNTNPVPASLFGVHVNKLGSHTNWPPLKQGLVRLWSTKTRWVDLQSSSNTWDFSRLDMYVNYITNNSPSCKILYTMGQTPLWASSTTNDTGNGPGLSSPPKNMSDWTNYVFQVAQRYKGVIRYYEVWNEVNAPLFYSGDISNMVLLTQLAKTVLTNVDPGIQMLSPNITPSGLDWMEQFLQAGGGGYPDIMSFHSYPTTRPEDDLPIVAGLNNLLSRYPEVSAKLLWNTEGAAADGVTDDQDRGIVSRCYLFQWAFGVQNFDWFCWDIWATKFQTNVPLSTNIYAPGPSVGGIAYSNTASWLIGAQVVSRTVDSNGTWVLELQRLGFKSGYVLWNPDRATSYAIPVSWHVYQQRDLSGNTTSLSGVTSASVGVEPILLDSVPSLLSSLSADNSTLTLCWSAPATGFNLYSTTNLAPAAWLPVTNAVITRNGVQQVSLARDNGNRCFRLSRP
jgi:hypothetical protein